MPAGLQTVQPRVHHNLTQPKTIGQSSAQSRPVSLNGFLAWSLFKRPGLDSSVKRRRGDKDRRSTRNPHSPRGECYTGDAETRLRVTLLPTHQNKRSALSRMIHIACGSLIRLLSVVSFSTSLISRWASRKFSRSARVCASTITRPLPLRL